MKPISEPTCQLLDARRIPANPNRRLAWFCRLECVQPRLSTLVGNIPIQQAVGTFVKEFDMPLEPPFRLVARRALGYLNEPEHERSR
jgi:hypothetical protein